METKTKKSHSVAFFLAGLLVIVIAAVGCLCFFSVRWYLSVYGNTGFDSVIFTLTNSMNGVHTDLIVKYILGAVVPTVFCCGIVGFCYFFPWKKRLPVQALTAALSLVLSVSITIQAAYSVGLVDYLVTSNQLSELYETNYVDPNSVEIRFPEEKRNLVYIVLESMETSYLSEDLGGGLPYNLIPELTALAGDNVNFSHNESIGGFREVPGASWTIGALVAHTAGVPLKVPDGIADWQNGYGKDGSFLPGLTTLQDILRQEGYWQALMVGSVASFGGRDVYYQTHGSEVYDLVTAYRDGAVEYGYWNDFWGMEDKYLFDYARAKITEMSQGSAPFAFTMLTVDTHHIGGFTCDLCGSTYEESYENAIACSSRQVLEFVQWIQAQPFYDNTTIVITGDHCSMDKGYFTRNIDSNYERHVYNCFINAAATPVRVKNRNFSALDMFPSTLAALGCTIEGDRLGLGTNLFANTPTLIERVGYLPFCTELSKRSAFYDQFYG